MLHVLLPVARKGWRGFSCTMTSMLRAAVILDYQNVHLTARDVFLPGQPDHLAIIHPMQFARAAVHQRNSGQRHGYPAAEVAQVIVYRGLPHSDHDPAQHARCSNQADQWRRDGAEVHLRDLTYKVQRGADGRPVLDINGKKLVQGKGREKGIDVLCALACVRLATAPGIDLVVLASRDTDLVPALDEVSDMSASNPNKVARIETFSWDDRTAPGPRFGSLRATTPRRIWNTNLDRRVFDAALDRNSYL